MANLTTLAPRLEKTLGRLKKQEQSLGGRIQNVSNLWLTRLEAHPFLKTYGGFLRKKTRPTSYLSQPAIDLDHLFPLSLILHLVLFLLLLQTRVTPPVTTKEAPVVVRILDLGQPAAESTRETPKRAPIKAPRPASKAPATPLPPKTPTEQKPTVAPSQETAPAPAPAPVLPGPRTLAEVPRENVPASAPASPESLVQLPTRQSETVQPSISTRIDLPTAPGAAETGASVPEGLRRSDNRPTSAPGSGGAPSTLSSPDFAPYLEMIKKRVQSVWKYPEGMTGSHRINVIFVLDRAGKLVRAEVADSTDPRLNNSALQAMRSASPFPPIPESLKELAGSPLRMRFNIDVGIRTGNKTPSKTTP